MRQHDVHHPGRLHRVSHKRYHVRRGNVRATRARGKLVHLFLQRHDELIQRDRRGRVIGRVALLNVLAGYAVPPRRRRPRRRLVSLLVFGASLLLLALFFAALSSGEI